jgi:uncharacterized protein (DUF2267 family)
MHKLDHMVQTAADWIDQVSDYLGCDSEHGYLALRAGLHALRDRMPAGEAIQLGAQLPTLIRGIYYEGWSPKHVPIKVRNREEFYDLVRRPFHAMDLSVDPERIAIAVFELLSTRVSQGEVDDVISTLPASIKDLFFM